MYNIYKWKPLHNWKLLYKYELLLISHSREPRTYPYKKKFLSTEWGKYIEGWMLFGCASSSLQDKNGSGKEIFYHKLDWLRKIWRLDLEIWTWRFLLGVRKEGKNPLGRRCVLCVNFRQGHEQRKSRLTVGFQLTCEKIYFTYYLR